MEKIMTLLLHDFAVINAASNKGNVYRIKAHESNHEDVSLLKNSQNRDSTRKNQRKRNGDTGNLVRV